MAAETVQTLQVPSTLIEDMRKAAARNGVSLQGFIIQALEEKVEAERAAGPLNDLDPEEQVRVLTDRASRAKEGRLLQILEKSGTTTEVLPGDEIPDGWFGGSGTARHPNPRTTG